jgi:S1-C subfamily serine protease
MKRLDVLFVVLITLCQMVFAQTGVPALRDHAGLINQSYHPDIVAYFEKIKANLEAKKDRRRQAIDLFLKGVTGSGFVIADEEGTNYIVTNYHVIARASRLSITFERHDGFRKGYDNLINASVRFPKASMTKP